ncbi:hypothetical protein COP2_045230 [Malus domestica]
MTRTHPAQSSANTSHAVDNSFHVKSSQNNPDAIPSPIGSRVDLLHKLWIQMMGFWQQEPVTRWTGYSDETTTPWVH